MLTEFNIDIYRPMKWANDIATPQCTLPSDQIEL